MATEQAKEISSRLGKVGGQAVLEGVMMRSGTAVALAVRQPDGGIVLDRSEFVSARKKHRALNFPILRGIVNFVEMLKLSYGTLMKSADLLGLEDELAAAPEGVESTAEDDEKRRKKAERAVKVTEAVSLVLGLCLAVGLFVVLPVCILGVFGVCVFRAGLRFLVRVRTQFSLVPCAVPCPEIIFRDFGGVFVFVHAL